jgi:arylsulfatase A-like enzyme
VRIPLRRILGVLVGKRPKALVPLIAPTALGIVIDLVLRPRSLDSFALQGKAIYASSWLVSAAFWFLPSWTVARLWGAHRRAAIALLAAWTFPLLTLAFAGQALYFRVFHLYMGRDTVRLGIALRGTALGWLASWGPPTGLAAIVLAGIGATVGLARLARRAAPAADKYPPLVAVLTFLGAIITCWVDGIDSRYLQAATPDACFFHGAVHALQIAITGKGGLHQGLSHRTPAPLPPIPPPAGDAKPPNVVVVLLESVRADALCSQPPPACHAPFLDAYAESRVPLGHLRTQTPSTFAACMTLWTGLAPNADLHAAHSAPVLWEIARAAGYRTAYIASQNPHYENFGLFTERAGIDVRLTADDLGGMGQEQIGAPDERALDAATAFVRDTSAHGEDARFFLLVHLSNTHAPYRIDRSLQPFAPASDDPVGDTTSFHNHYRNSVRLLERSLASFVKDLRASPQWEDTVLVVLSDHGEQFREHGMLYHNHSLHEEELNVPAWLLAGPRALDDERRAALASYASAKTYMQDMHVTIVDLFGVERSTLPYPNPIARSLVRPRPPEEPLVLISTTTAVWEPDEPYFGALWGARKVTGAAAGGWMCEDQVRHGFGPPANGTPWCAQMTDRVKQSFPERLGR